MLSGALERRLRDGMFTPMPSKSARKPQKKRPEKDPEQYARFVEVARDAEASENPKDLERVLKRVAPGKKSPPFAP
jgi:hypothetical protein